MSSPFQSPKSSDKKWKKDYGKETPSEQSKFILLCSNLNKIKLKTTLKTILNIIKNINFI